VAPPSPDLVPELPLLALLFFTMARFAGIQKKLERLKKLWTSSIIYRR
jgi:hypothetical protein